MAVTTIANSDFAYMQSVILKMPVRKMNRFCPAGDDALPAFKYLMACGAKYNQQTYKELGELPSIAPADIPITAQAGTNFKAAA